MRRDRVRFNIRRRLAGLSLDDVGELLRINTDRGAGRELAASVLGEPDPVASIEDLKDALRVALNRGPDLRVVFRELAVGELVAGRAGRNVRWTRIILDLTLRGLSEAVGQSIAYWSEFERDEKRAERAIASSLSEDQADRLGFLMKFAALRLGGLFPSSALPFVDDPAIERDYHLDPEHVRARAAELGVTIKEGV